MSPHSAASRFQQSEQARQGRLSESSRLSSRSHTMFETGFDEFIQVQPRGFTLAAN